MASRQQMSALSLKLQEFGKSLPAEEQEILASMIDRAESDPLVSLGDGDLEKVAGGKKKAWAQGGCFSPGRTANPPG